MSIKSYFLTVKNRLGIFFWFWVGFFLCPFLIYGIWQAHDFLVNDGDLVVAFSTALLPHQVFKEGERRGHGFDYAIAYLIAQRLRKNLKIKEGSFIEALKELNTGTIDLICAAMSMTDGRIRDMAMVHVYGTSDPYMSLVFWNSSLYKKLSSACVGETEISVHRAKLILNDGLIGVLTGKVWASALKKYGFNNFKSYEYEQDMISALASGNVAVAVMGENEAKYLKKQNPNIQILEIVLDVPWSHGAGIAIKKDRTELIKNVTEVIQDLKNEGVIALEQQRWFGRVCN